MSGKVIRVALVAAIAVTGLVLLPSSMSQEAQGEPAAVFGKIAELIKQLDSASFREREEAHQALVNLPGVMAEQFKPLRASASSPEVRGRLDQIIAQRCRGSWKTDLGQALSAARGEDKLVMVFSTRGPRDGYSCMGANLMRQVTFSNERLVQDLRHQVVAVWHNQNGALGARGFGMNCKAPPSQAPPTAQMIKAYPVGGGGGNLRTYFCTPSGKIVHYVEGYWPVAHFAAELRVAQARYRAMKETPAAAMSKEVAADLNKDIAAIELQRAEMMRQHPAEFKKPFPQSEIRRRHASLGLKVKAYRDGTKLAGKDISPVLAQIMAMQIGRGAIV
jgi:hypothetical protein